MQYFYDGQIRRYLTQIVRVFSNFSYRDGDGDTKVVPVMYGDLTRQVSSIMRDNSENKLPSAPRMAVYVTGLEMDRTRSSDSSFVSKINLRERAYDSNTGTYSPQQAKGYTVERLHPSPYTLSVNVDIWSTSTEQKLQILEQILMLFNPDLEIQTTDNYIDWTSLSLLRLETTTFSSRSIPVGAGDDIDVATLGFTTPIYISPPVKVKKLGVITNIITSIFNPDAGTIELDGFNPPTDSETSVANGTVVLGDGTVISQSPVPDGVVTGPYDPDITRVLPDGTTVLPDGTLANNRAVQINKTIVTGNGRLDNENPLVVSYRAFDLILSNGTAKLAKNRQLRVDEIPWTHVLEAELPARYQPGISQLILHRAELSLPIIGVMSFDPNDDFTMYLDYDEDTLPSDTLFEGPVSTRGTIDRIVNPRGFNPTSTKTVGTRYVFTQPIGNAIEETYTVTQASNRIETDLDYTISSSSVPGRSGDNTVTSFEVYVDDVQVSATGTNVDGKFVIILDETPEIDSVVYYNIQLNEDGADAWKNADGTDFNAGFYDIVEWDGTKWHKLFDARAHTGDAIYVTNLQTGQQIYFNGYYWQPAIDGYYPRGTWEIQL